MCALALVVRGTTAIHGSAQAFVAPDLTESTSVPSAPSSLLTLPPAGGPVTQDDGKPLSVTGFPLRVLKDELHVVTSPARIRTPDLIWLLPLTGATAVAFATDTRANREVVSHDPGFNNTAGTASDVLRGGFIGAPVALFAVGELAKSDRPREAGLLGGEVMVDAYAFGAVAKLITLRERPYVDQGRGSFFDTSAGWDSSFPSGHALVAWSSAAVLAGEYSRPWQQFAIYTLASGASLTRVMADQHFPSDVLIGSAAGWLIGHYVYKAHHRKPK